MAETRIQSTESVLAQLVKLQLHMEAKLTDLEGHSRRDNIRLHGIKERAVIHYYNGFFWRIY